MNPRVDARRRERGLTLIEMMIVVAILGVITAIAIPMITGYTSTARSGVMRDNIESIRLMEDNYRLSSRAYVQGTYNPSSPDAAGGLKDLLGWEPRTEADNITYTVVCGTVTTAPRCTVEDGYYVRAVDSGAPSEPVCVAYGNPCP